MTPSVRRQIAAAKRAMPKRPAKPSKYRNVKTVVDGITFASKREAKRYGELRLLQRAGKIKCLAMQATWIIKIRGIVVCRYIADYQYHDCRTGQTVIEDVKSPATRKNRAYRIKCKLMKAVHDIDIVEV